jgi:glycosyltransferase involved in cell wall biosynthesis
MEKASVYIVPIRIGGGTRLKIYEAMAMELPTVSTKIGAKVCRFATAKKFYCAMTPQAFAEAVLKLLKDKSLAEKIGEQAGKTVRKSSGWQKVADDFAEICERAIEMRKA